MTVKKAFRILSLFMIFILTITSAVSLVSVTAVATAPKTYTDISADSEKEVNITHDGEIIYFRFVPAKSGTYAFYSTEYENYPYGFLYDENMEDLDVSINRILEEKKSNPIGANAIIDKDSILGM
jgi:hypothetical protein